MIQGTEQAEPSGQKQKLSVLAIFPYTPNQVRVRSYLALQALAHSFCLDVIYLQDTSEPAVLPASVRQTWEISNRGELARGLRLAAGLLRRFPLNHEFYNSPKLPALLRSLPLERYDAVYVERLPVHRIGLQHPRTIYDCVDCFSELSKQLSGVFPGPRRLLYKVDSWLLPAQERKACAAATCVLVAATREKARLQELGVKVPIVEWINDRRSPLQPRKLERRPKFVISFHGKLSYAANLIALKDIDEKIAPFLPQDRAELRIIGRSSRGIERAFKNLCFTGFVPSIEEAVRESDVCILPMRVSVGFPNKAMESLACGVPIIATEALVGGLPDWQRLSENGIYVRPIEKFVDQVLSMMALPLQTRETIAENCRFWAQGVYETSEERFSWEALLGALKHEQEETCA